MGGFQQERSLVGGSYDKDYIARWVPFWGPHLWKPPYGSWPKLTFPELRNFLHGL